MKIDVSDLFSRLYDFTCLARHHFDPRTSQEECERLQQWAAFCSRLSDSLFLPACAARAFSLTHATLPLAAVKPRLIIKRVSENGKGIAFCRYEDPCQHSSAFCELGHDNFTGRPLNRVPIVLWLGKLPPERMAATPPAYPSDLNVPVRYFARQYLGFFRSTGPRTNYYELHGEWCLRRIEQVGPKFIRQQLNGEWLQPPDLMEIDAAVFNEVWEGAADGPTSPRPQ